LTDKNVIEYKTRVLILFTIFVCNFSQSKKNCAIRSKCILYWSSCEVPLFLSGFIETWILSTDFRKYSYQISSKSIRLEPSCSMLTDCQTVRQTWRWYLIIVAFRNLRMRLKTFAIEICNRILRTPVADWKLEKSVCWRILWLL